MLYLSINVYFFFRYCYRHGHSRFDPPTASNTSLIDEKV